MTPAEFSEARRLLPESDSELAATLGIDEATLSNWAAGRKRIPATFADFFRTMSVIMRREAALATSNLPECEWIRDHARPPANRRASISMMQDVQAHMVSCDICRTREQYADERVGPVSVEASSRSGGQIFMARVGFVWNILLGIALLLAAASTGMFREPITWVLVAIVAAVLSRRWWGFRR